MQARSRVFLNYFVHFTVSRIGVSVDRFVRRADANLATLLRALSRVSGKPTLGLRSELCRRSFVSADRWATIYSVQGEVFVPSSLEFRKVFLSEREQVVIQVLIDCCPAGWASSHVCDPWLGINNTSS